MWKLALIKARGTGAGFPIDLGGNESRPPAAARHHQFIAVLRLRAGSRLASDTALLAALSLSLPPLLAAFCCSRFMQLFAIISSAMPTAS